MSNASQVQAQHPSWRTFGAEVLEWTHHTLMMVGFFVVAAGAYLYMHPQTVLSLEKGVTQWVVARKAAVEELQALGQQAAAAEPVVEVAMPAGPQLNHTQMAVANWLSRRYSIAPLAMQELVSSAWQVGKREQLDPTLILAVMAVESSFNPYAQSSVGATGLMQVMANVHRDKFAPYGGPRASIDPLANVRVGALVLKDAIVRGGSLQAGLRMYVGATSDATEGGYAAKVMAEQARLAQIVASSKPAANAAVTAAAPETKPQVPAPKVEQTAQAIVAAEPAKRST
ncbi:MAG: transglycosylase SLT domain-containing protein [Burkholderiales bacterium]|jgi:soluble lytic murein transglycosylase-like protein|nr:transglycosylase SLT domain-containing protein [Burkholderiales bacterium]